MYVWNTYSYELSRYASHVHPVRHFFALSWMALDFLPTYRIILYSFLSGGFLCSHPGVSMKLLAAFMSASLFSRDDYFPPTLILRIQWKSG